MRDNSGPQYRGDTIDPAILFPPKIVNFKNVGPVALVLGDACALVLADVTHGLGGAVEQLDVSDANFHLIIGGAAAAIPVGEVGPVIVEGYQAAANVVDGTAAGAQLSGGAADGRLAVVGDPAGNIEWSVAARLLAAPASNLAPVRWCNLWGY